MKFLKSKLPSIILAIAIVLSAIGYVMASADSKISKTEIYYGDIDMNGEISVKDARLTLRSAVGLESYSENSTEFELADTDRDGIISIDDARLVLRTAIGLSSPVIYENEYETEQQDAESYTLSPEQEQLLKEEEQKKEKLTAESDQSLPEETKNTSVTEIMGDGINTCIYCGKNCRQDEYGNDACAKGGCTRTMVDIVCQYCGETIKANTCHTCVNPSNVITTLPVK